METLYIHAALLLSSMACTAVALYIMRRSARFAARLYDVELELVQTGKRMKMLEMDFGEKWDHTMRKLTSRTAMREKRESEDLNKPNGGIIM